MVEPNVVQTVLGEIPAQALGITYSHEHLAMNPGDPVHYADSIFDDAGKILRELTDFTSFGGRTIVEMTPLNFGRDVRACQEISRAAGIHVICATGFHKEEFIPPWFAAHSDREIIELLKGEIGQGIADTGVRPGVIKIGSSYQRVMQMERRAIQIAAIVQQETGLPISTHCDKGTMALEQCALFTQFGARPEKVILGHVDIPNDADYLKQICALGFNVQVDHVGRDRIHQDSLKVELIRGLIESGLIDQIFLSGDMGKRMYLKVYGGQPGLGYILGPLKGYLLAKGVTEAQIEQILVDNPRRVFGVRAAVG